MPARDHARDPARRHRHHAGLLAPERPRRARRSGGFANPVFFTATGMIGMIALGGHRDPQLDHPRRLHPPRAAPRGCPLRDAILESGVVRFRPILLTAGAAMLGAWPITLDPIFSGLAWCLIFGLARLDGLHAGRRPRRLPRDRAEARAGGLATLGSVNGGSEAREDLLRRRRPPRGTTPRLEPCVLELASELVVAAHGGEILDESQHVERVGVGAEGHPGIAGAPRRAASDATCPRAGPGSRPRAGGDGGRNGWSPRVRAARVGSKAWGGVVGRAMMATNVAHTL